MKVAIITPDVPGVRTGNRSSAEQWRDVLSELGHAVTVGSSLPDEVPDTVVVLHAVKGAETAVAARERFPKAALVVVMTGTDIYPEPSPEALATMAAADFLVALQARAAEQLPAELRDRVRVIVQASRAGGPRQKKSRDPFDVCVVGHLRDVKAPMLTAQASRLLPAESKIRVRHAGAILDPKYEALVATEEQENPRYHWLDQLETDDVRALIATSQLLVLTSLSEGAGRVVGSAITKGTPVLATRIDGVVGLLGDDYPGYFPVNDTEALAALLARAEGEAAFLEVLRERCDALRPLFAPERELAGWRDLLDEWVAR